MKINKMIISIILMLAMILLVELASASHITIDERFENNNTDNISGIPSSYCGESNGTIFSQGLSTLGGCVYNGSYNGWNNGNITGNILNSNTNNVTCDFQMKVDDGGQAGNSNLMLFHGGSISVAGADAIPLEISWKLSLSGAQVRLYDGGWDDVDSFLNLGIYNDYTWNNVSIRFLQNASADVFINTTKYVGNLQSTPPINTRNWSFIKLTDVSLNARTWWDNITCYNGTSFNEPAIIETPTNISPTITINTPLNNTRRHNATLDINFTISTFSPNINISFFDVYIDYNSNPTSRINHSVNMTSGNFTITFTIVNVTGSSINNTYSLKINLTDNASNNVNTFIIFNLTNDISQYNVTNVSITPLPLSVNVNVKCHFNLTNYANNQTSFPNQSDNISLSDIRWWINGSILATANNNTMLNAPNVTLDANVTCQPRVNPGYGDTGWTIYVFAPNLTVGDITSPLISGQAINGNSFTTDERINTTLNCTDNTLVNYARVEWNRTGVFANDTMSLLNPNQYSYSSLFAVGSYNITNFYCADGSSNIARDTSNFTFTVTSPPSGGGSSSAGGGGGTAIKTITIKEGLPFLSFGGLTLIDFQVISTPSKKVKIVRFKNVGNVTFADADVHIEGNAKKYVTPFICNLNLQKCINESISIKAGESMFLVLNGTFTEEIGEGTSGSIKIQEDKKDGVTHELNLLITRPPFYSIFVKPLVNAMEIPELLAFIVVYTAIGLSLIGGIWFITIL